MKFISSFTLFLLIFIYGNHILYAQEPGDFSVRLGFQARDSPRDSGAGRPSQRGAQGFSVSLNKKISLGADFTSPFRKKSADGSHITSIGDLFINASGTLRDEVAGTPAPAISLSYSIKIPTAQTKKFFGTGKVDHQILGTIKKSFGDGQKTSVDFSLGEYFAGKIDTKGFTSSLVLVLGAERKFGTANQYKFRSEFNFAGKTSTALADLYANHYLQYKVNKKISVRAGLRTGIAVNSAKVGVFGTLIYSGNLKKVF